MTTITPSPVEAKICKLLRLSANNPSVEEAAVAFARAQELATLHNLQLDDLMERSAAEQAPEAPREVGTMHRTKIDSWDRVVLWKYQIAQAVARANGCRVAFWSGRGGGIACYGQEQDIATTRYVYMAIVREVERMATAAVSEYSAARHPSLDESARVYGRSWRLGCAHAIGLRMPRPDREIRRVRGELEAARQAALAESSDNPDGLLLSDQHALETASTALVRVEAAAQYQERLEATVKDFYDKHVRRSGPSFAGAGSGRGYARGREAGGRVSLGGGGRALGSAS